MLITPQQEHHLVRVLRMKSGDRVIAFTESQGEFLCSLERKDHDKWYLTPLEHIKEPEEKWPVTLGIALIKKDRLKFALEASTQLGCCSITLLLCDRSQMDSFNKDKALKQIIGSVEQSGRCKLPTLLGPIDLETFIGNADYILCANESSKDLMSDVGPITFPVCVLVGPEGGFSPREQGLLLSSNKVVNVSLGGLILRSEVAAISILSQVAFKSVA